MVVELCPISVQFPMSGFSIDFAFFESILISEYESDELSAGGFSILVSRTNRRYVNPEI